MTAKLDADLAAKTAKAQQLLDALLIEQRDTPDEITRVRRSGDAAVYAQALLRKDNLPHEIHDAQVALARAQLAQKWASVGPAIAAADTARDAHLAAAAERQAHDARPTRPVSNASEAAAAQVEYARLVDAATAARAAHDTAEHMAAAALYEIDALEDHLELLTGERSTPTDGPAPPRPLGRTAVVTAPTGYGTDVRTYAAGTIPPRWAAFLLRHSTTVWAAKPATELPRHANVLAVDDGFTYQAGARPDDAA